MAKVSALLRCYADLRKVIIPTWVSVTTWVTMAACIVTRHRVVNPEV
jgi:Flp pilus assembly protein protease CpaA